MTADEVRNMLRVNKHRLDDELEIQPEIMQRIADRVVLMNSRMLECKDDLARVESRLTEDIKEDEPRLTVGQLDAKVKRHADRTRAWQKFQAARAEYEEWTSLLESWRQKGYSLKTLSELYAAQYFSVNYVDGARRVDTGASRAALREASTQASATTRRRVLSE